MSDQVLLEHIIRDKNPISSQLYALISQTNISDAQSQLIEFSKSHEQDVDVEYSKYDKIQNKVFIIDPTTLDENLDPEVHLNMVFPKGANKDTMSRNLGDLLLNEYFKASVTDIEGLGLQFNSHADTEIASEPPKYNLIGPVAARVAEFAVKEQAAKAKKEQDAKDKEAIKVKREINAVENPPKENPNKKQKQKPAARPAKSTAAPKRPASSAKNSTFTSTIKKEPTKQEVDPVVDVDNDSDLEDKMISEPELEPEQDLTSEPQSRKSPSPESLPEPKTRDWESPLDPITSQPESEEEKLFVSQSQPSSAGNVLNNNDPAHMDVDEPKPASKGMKMVRVETYVEDEDGLEELKYVWKEVPIDSNEAGKSSNKSSPISQPVSKTPKPEREVKQSSPKKAVERKGKSLPKGGKGKQQNLLSFFGKK